MGNVCYNAVVRKLLLIPLLIAVFGVIVFLLGGSSFVLNYARQKAETSIADATGMQIAIGRVSGNLFYSVQLEEVDLADAVRIDRLAVNYNPFRLLSKELDIKSVRVWGLQIALARLQEIFKDIPESGVEETGEAPSFAVKISEFSIENSSLFGKLGAQPVEVALATRGSMSSTMIVLDSLRLATGRSKLVVRGIIPLSEKDELGLEYNMSLMSEDLGIEDLSGDIHGEGSVVGTFSTVRLRALTELAVRYLENDLNGVVELEWLLPDFAGLRLDASLTALTKSFRQETNARDTSQLHVSINNKNLECLVRSNLGNLRVRGDLRDDITRPYFHGTVAGDFDYLDFEPGFAGKVHYEDDVLSLSNFNLKSRRVVLDLRGKFDTRKGKISNTQVKLTCSDLGLWNTFIKAPPDLAGQLRCDLNIWGTVDVPKARAKLIVTDAVVYGENIARVDFDLSLDGSVARIDSGFIQNERGEIVLAGHYDYRIGDFAASLYTGGVIFKPPETFGGVVLPLGGTLCLDLVAQGNVQAPFVKGRISVGEFIYDTLSFGNYDLDVQLEDDSLHVSLMSRQEDLVLDGTLVLDGSFPFHTDLDLRHYVLDRYVAPATGFVTAQISAQGVLAEIIDATGMINIDKVQLLAEGQLIENSGVVSVQLKDRILHIDQCNFLIAGQSVFASGSLPLDFTAGSMDVAANSGNIQLADIAYLLPRDPAIRGLLRFDLRLQGRPKALDIDGMLSLAGASYGVDGIAVDSVDGLVRFRNGLATVEHVTGKINKGRFGITGFIDVSPGSLDTMLLDIKLNRIDYSNKNFGNIVCSAALQLGARKDSMQIRGEVVIDEGAYTAPMKLQTYVGLLTNANRPEPQQPEIARRVYCDVGISAPDSILIKNNVADLAVRADLQLKGYLAKLNVYGTIAAIDEGTVKYLGKKFTIVNAVIQFDDPYKIDPAIDLTAKSTIAAADGDYEVFLFLTGTTTNWQLELNSNPPLPEQDIVSLILIGQRRPGAVGGMTKEFDLKGKVRDYALDMVRHNIEKTTEEVLGLDKFTLTGDLSDPSTMRIGIEKSITKGFRLQYSTGLESWELYQVGASYDLTEKISISTMYDQENRNTSVDLELNLKIK